MTKATLNGMIVGDYIIVSHGHIESIGGEDNPQGATVCCTDMKFEFTTDPAELFVRNKIKKLDLVKIQEVTHQTLKGYDRDFDGMRIFSLDGQEIYVGRNVEEYIASLPKMPR